MLKSMKTLLPIGCLALALAGCGEISEEMSSGFEEGMVEEFAQACKTESEGLGVPAEISSEACDCAAERSVEELSVTEMLSGDTPKIDAIMEACFNEITGEGAPDVDAPAPSDQPVEES